MIEVVEGWTGAIDQQLKADGVAVDLTAMTVVLELTGNDDVAVNTAGNVSLLDAATGKVRYFPDAADLLAAKSPYRARYKVTDGASKITYFPSASPDNWIVRKP